MKKLLIGIMLLSVLILPSLNTARLQAQGDLGKAEDLKVSPDEITAAKQSLGDSLVGVLACTLETEYHSTVANNAVDQLKAYGLKAELFDSQVKADRQISAIESFVSRGVKVLIICEFDPKAIDKTLKDAADKGVQIIQFAGRNAASVGGVTISVEDADLGYAAGEYAGKLITSEMGGKATVAILDYPDLPQVVVRADNIEKALKKEAPNATIVGRFLGGTPDNGLKSMESALQKTPDINVIVSINDAGALGAVKALEGAKKDPKSVIVVGIDAEKQAKDYILKDYFFRGTVDTSPKITGQLTAQAAVKLLAKSKFLKNIAVPVTLLDKKAIQDQMTATAAPTMAATEAATFPKTVSNGKYNLTVTKVERASEWRGNKPKSSEDVVIAVSFETNDPDVFGGQSCGTLKDASSRSWTKPDAAGLGGSGKITDCVWAAPKAATGLEWKVKDYPSISLGF
ncbi:MAG: sugar ABC transporter substrate-binding protein [Anaerolineae bacterium]|nr:sugar ABC transporter substrate-binding protein [Anaerolineae bacterium]